MSRFGWFVVALVVAAVVVVGIRAIEAHVSPGKPVPSATR